MTDLRTAAQQALEALELGYDSAKAEADQYHAAMAGYRPQRHAQMDADVQQIASAITTLKAALAEPVQEPMAMLWQHRETGRTRVLMPNERTATDVAAAWDVVGPLYLAPPQRPAEPVQGPAAWRYKKEGGGWFVSDNEPQYVEQWNDIEEIQPLYTAPPQRKPLTEEEIDSIWDGEKAFADIYAIARAIERAHGIV